jgi:hypothetical protein
MNIDYTGLLKCVRVDMQLMFDSNIVGLEPQFTQMQDTRSVDIVNTWQSNSLPLQSNLLRGYVCPQQCFTVVLSTLKSYFLLKLSGPYSSGTLVLFLMA